MRIWDISRTLSNELAEWPGDEPFHFQLTKTIAEGQSVNLGTIEMSVHNGTHADARFHFDTKGESIEKAPLEIYLGRAVVVDLREAFSQSKGKHLITIEDFQPHSEEIAETSRVLVKTGRWSNSAVFPSEIPVIAIEDLRPSAEAIAATSRLLVKTGRWSDSTVFPNQIPVIAADVPAWLQKNGVKLLGLDLPSVDEIDSKSLQNHHALDAAGVAIVESLDLSGAGAGIYDFAALPLKIAGGDGAPMRAVLWRD